MTFKIIAKINKSLPRLTKYCYDLIPLMKPDPSYYAPNRYRLWLFKQPYLTQCQAKPAYFDKRLWNFAQRIYPGCHTALLTFGGNAKGISSNGKIDWHRDANFALPIARAINLGTFAIFGYDSNRHNSTPGRKTEQIFQLTPGDIIEFNCKHRHALLAHSPERFSIIFWKMRKEYLKSVC
jgi:hypothetical protein